MKYLLISKKLTLFNSEKITNTQSTIFCNFKVKIDGYFVLSKKTKKNFFNRISNSCLNVISFVNFKPKCT